MTTRLAPVEAKSDTSSDLKIRLIDHIAELLSDVEMTDSDVKEMEESEIVEMHERNVDLAGFIVGSLGTSGATAEAEGYSARINPVDPHGYVDAHLSGPRSPTPESDVGAVPEIV